MTLRTLLVLVTLAASSAALGAELSPAERQETDRKLFEDKRFGILLQLADVTATVDATAVRAWVQATKDSGALYLTVTDNASYRKNLSADLTAACKDLGLELRPVPEYLRGNRLGDIALRTPQEVVAAIARATATGANFLLEIGPDASGRLDAGKVAVLKEVGAWFATNAASVQCMQAGDVGDGKDVVSTRIGSLQVLHFLNPAIREFTFRTDRQYVEALCFDRTASATLKKTSDGYRVTVRRPDTLGFDLPVKLIPKLEAPFASKSFCIGVPNRDTVDRFCDFIRNRLAKDGLDTLFLRINYNYRYKSHPECVAPTALTETQLRKIANTCRMCNIRLIPLMNTVGHQSWRTNIGQFLKAHPETDEAPGKPVLDNYCRSFCPRHPLTMPIMLDLAEELMRVIDTDEFHIGCDEIFEIGTCERCRSASPADLLAEWVNGMNAGLKKRGLKRLYIWADRLIEYVPGRFGDTIYGESDNGTAAALGKIDKDVILCDWHYSWRFTYPSIDRFRDAGYRSIPSVWNEVQSAERFADYAARHGGESVLGLMFTTWDTCAATIDGIEGKETESKHARLCGEVYRAYFGKPIQ